MILNMFITVIFDKSHKKAYWSAYEVHTKREKISKVHSWHASKVLEPSTFKSHVHWQSTHLLTNHNACFQVHLQQPFNNI